MEYTTSIFEEVVERFGEAVFVLDSDREYIIHGKEGYEFKHIGKDTLVRAEGLQGDEYVVVEFPLDAVEHHYKHKEL